MRKLTKKNIIVASFILILINITIGFLLLKSRSFSHLAIWRIVESDTKKDFYWRPEDAPRYFRFEPDTEKLSIFRSESLPLIKNEGNELEITLGVARYMSDIRVSRSMVQATRLRWGSPEEMLGQIKEGARTNCFHRSVLFSTYLSSLGMKSRLWALENEKFDGTAHTVTEVYIRGLRKWVFIDAMLGLYVTENGKPLSFLELRERLLDGDSDTISVHNIHGEIDKEIKLPFFYTRLIKCVFLRAGNDFVDRYNTRYGIFSIFQRYIDKLPDDIRRGLDYLLGERDVFIHYVDEYNRSLKPEIITARLLFYFIIFSLVSISVLLITLLLVFLKFCLATNLSKKDTRHR